MKKPLFTILLALILFGLAIGIYTMRTKPTGNPNKDNTGSIHFYFYQDGTGKSVPAVFQIFKTEEDYKAKTNALVTDSCKADGIKIISNLESDIDYYFHAWYNKQTNQATIYHIGPKLKRGEMRDVDIVLKD